MASIMCRKCENGIHYHDMPNGTEWKVFELNTWQDLIQTPVRLIMYEDSETGWYNVWRCKHCGTLHFFKAYDLYLYKAFAPTEDTAASIKEGIKCIAFDDITWDEMTETDEIGTAFDGVFKDMPRKYPILFKDSLLVYSDNNYEHLEQAYHLIYESEIDNLNL